MPRELPYEEKQSLLLAAFDDLLHKKLETVQIKSNRHNIMLSRQEWKELVEECQVEQMDQDVYRITAPVVQFFPIVAAGRFNLTKTGVNINPAQLFEELSKIGAYVGGGIGAVTGLGTGAVIGTAILPGVGSVIGGGIGAVAGWIGGGVTGAVVGGVGAAVVVALTSYADYMAMFEKAGYSKQRPLTSANFLQMLGRRYTIVGNRVEVYFSWSEWTDKIKEFAPKVLKIKEHEYHSLKGRGDDLLIQLNTWNEEYREIEALVRKSMPQAVIHEICKNYNEFLLRRYENCQKSIHLEKLLFHGTRQIDPLYIYGGQTGFDVGESKQGMWGYGIYFAVNASYSSAYHYEEQGKCQILVAKVLIGTYAEVQQNTELRYPPNGRDSVKGYTQGSEVYVVYKNEQCYPAYLITYTK